MTSSVRLPVFSFAAALVFLFAALAIPTYAQPMWQRAFGYQIDVLLRSADPDVQETALQVFIEVANRNHVNANLRPATNALMNVYRTSPDPAHRLMAAVALTKIDDPRSYTALLSAALEDLDLRSRQAVLHGAAGSRSIRSARVATAYNELLRQDRFVSAPGTAATLVEPAPMR
jgi:hypothetical protein